MAEFKFILKVFIFCSVLMIALQFEVRGQRAEVLFTQYLRHGTLTLWVKDVVDGAEVLVKKTAKDFPQYLSFISTDEPKPKKAPAISSDIPDIEFPDDEVTTVNLNDATDF